MQKMIRKVVSFNLFGETPREARTRIIKQRARAITSGKTPEQVRRLPYSVGLNPQAVARRSRILRKARLPLKMPRITDIYSR